MMTSTSPSSRKNKIAKYEKNTKFSTSIYSVKDYQIERVLFLVAENNHLWVLIKRWFV